MGFAIAKLRWRASDFWAATAHEVFSAVEFLEAAAQRKPDEGA